MKTMSVRCEKNGSDYGPPLTDGKVYEARHYANAVWAIRDDRGCERFVIPGEPCPHLQQVYETHGFTMSRSVGKFVEVASTSSCAAAYTAIGLA
jgi:hypothetical protein